MFHCDVIMQALRRRGYRLTPQREMIIEAISHGNRHMTAEEVFEEIRLRSQAVNIATVYRTLDLLVEEGLVSRADLGGGRVVYATARHGPHVHLVCRYCGFVTDADVAPFQQVFDYISRRHGFTCGPQHFAVTGLCGGCREAASEPEVSAKEV